MNDELDEARAVAELTAAYILDRLHSSIIIMITDALMEETTEKQMQKIQVFLKKKPRKQKFERTALDHLKDLSMRNPSATEDELRKMFFELPHNLEKLEDTKSQAFRRAFSKFSGSK